MIAVSLIISLLIFLSQVYTYFTLGTGTYIMFILSTVLKTFFVIIGLPSLVLHRVFAVNYTHNSFLLGNFYCFTVT